VANPFRSLVVATLWRAVAADLWPVAIRFVEIYHRPDKFEKRISLALLCQPDSEPFLKMQQMRRVTASVK
jgi:hypothetical protein